MSEDGEKSIFDRKYEAALHPDDPRVQIYILADRVENLTKEKEAVERKYDDLQKRVARMERSFDRGAGVLLVIPIIGAILGWLISYWRVVFKPWIGPGQ